MTLTTLSAPDLARGIASGQFSACEVLDAHLGRIAATDTRVNAFTGICHARARTQAQAVDAKRARGEALPPLAGVPYACLLYTSPSPRDGLLSRMPSSA